MVRHRLGVQILEELVPCVPALSSMITDYAVSCMYVMGPGGMMVGTALRSSEGTTVKRFASPGRLSSGLVLTAG